MIQKNFDRNLSFSKPNENIAKAECKYYFNFAHIVVSDQKLLVMNVQGKCGGSTVKTEMFKFVTTDVRTNITTEKVVYETNRQVSMELSNFN